MTQLLWLLKVVYETYSYMKPICVTSTEAMINGQGDFRSESLPFSKQPRSHTVYFANRLKWTQILCPFEKKFLTISFVQTVILFIIFNRFTHTSLKLSTTSFEFCINKLVDAFDKTDQSLHRMFTEWNPIFDWLKSKDTHNNNNNNIRQITHRAVNKHRLEPGRHLVHETKPNTDFADRWFASKQAKAIQIYHRSANTSVEPPCGP